MIDTPLLGRAVAPEIQVMSYNIRRRMAKLRPGSPDQWVHRRGLVERLLAAEQPTVLGVQEALPDQAGFVRHALGEHYRSIGYGRQANKKGEGCPIFFDNARLRLEEWSQTALSSTPGVPGSTSWGNPTPRVVGAATFTDRITGLQFRALNTHFDQFSRRSRLLSADEIVRLVGLSTLPAVVTGDFNTDEDSLPHDRIIRSGALRDFWDAAADHTTEDWGTFPNYRAPTLERKRIDWILVSSDVSVRKAAINVMRFDGRWASDHAPVQAIVTFSPHT